MAHDQYELFLKALEKKRAPGVTAAKKLLALRRFDDADRAVTSLDDSIYGGVAIAKMYEAHLQELITNGELERDRAHVEDVFHRGLSWAQWCYPEVHTAVEAENYEAGRSEDRARLVRILGYDPDASGG